MALRLRRGLDLDRVGVIFAEGELVYATDTKRLHIGDGVTAGGIPVGDLLGDTSPQLGATLDLNTHSVVGLGTIAIDGNISSTGVIQAGTIEGNFKGTFSADDSTILIDGVNNKLVLDNNELNDIGNVNLSNEQLKQFLKWSGTSWQNSYITLEDLVDVVTGGAPQVGQVLKYDGANWVASEDATASGNIVGDLKGSVFGDDSTVLVDALNGFINLSRNNLSDLHDVAVDQATNDQVLAWNGVRWAPTDLGSIQLDYLTGDVKGSVFSDDSTVLVDAVNRTINLTNNRLTDLQDVNTFNALPGDVLTFTGTQWIAEGGIGQIRETDIQGSVYGIDSSIILDATSNTIIADSIQANSFYPVSNETTFYPNEALGTSQNRIYLVGYEDKAVLHLMKYSLNSLAADTTRVGTIVFSKEDTVNGRNNIAAISANAFDIPSLWISHSEANPVPVLDNSIILQEGNLGIGNSSPTEKLDVAGNIKVSGFTQFGSYTTTERDDLTTTNNPQYALNYGMVIYNTTTNTFQGWQNTGGTTPEWVNLS